MPGPPYRGLRIILGIFSLLTTVGGLVIIFSGRPMAMRFFSRAPRVRAALPCPHTSLRELMLLSGLRSSAHQVRHFVGQR